MEHGDIEALIAQMTLEEKAGMCSGLNRFETKGIERLGIPSIQMFDGPNGLRKIDGGMHDDDVGVYRALYSTCYPTGSALGASWSTSLMRETGRMMAVECQAEDVPLLLGPSMNMKRSPLCGRNFEYLAEDPFLCGRMAAAIVQGMQQQGVGACLKHYAANSQEDKRHSVDSIIDERTLREIYLAAFELAIREAQPWTVMCSYNKVNGQHTCRNKHLLADILRGEWGYEGVVMSDWGGTKDRVEALEAGLDLEMPYTGGENDALIVEAVRAGRLNEAELDRSVYRLLKAVFKMDGLRRQNAVYDKSQHHAFARRAAAECMVLLKNEGRVLPLDGGDPVAVIGEMAKETRYQGGGSAHVNALTQTNLLGELEKQLPQVYYAAGYSLERDATDDTLLAEAEAVAARCPVAVVVVGLPAAYESEGYDRTHMRIPQSHIDLIERVAKVNPNTVVVAMNGAPIEMDWEPRVKGILEAYLAGQAAAEAICDLLLGIANPSGRLAESFPLCLEHNPSFLNYATGDYSVTHHERQYIGYRYYQKKRLPVRFPFGHGLSYTTFEYSGLGLRHQGEGRRQTVEVRFTLENTGETSGKEVVQLYVAPADTRDRPMRELRAFDKIELAPGQKEELCFTLDYRAFAIYHTGLADWSVPAGGYYIEVGASCEDIRLRGQVAMACAKQYARPIDEDTIIGDLLDDPRTADLAWDLLAGYAENVLMARAGGLGREQVRSRMGNMPLRQARLYSDARMSIARMQECIARMNRALKG